MTAQDIATLYEQQIKPLSRADQLLLLARIAEELAAVDEEDAEELSLLDLEGIGAEVWRGVDTQEYVNQLRDEWEQP